MKINFLYFIFFTGTLGFWGSLSHLNLGNWFSKLKEQITGAQDEIKAKRSKIFQI